jgi:hypothetical protein
VQVTERWWQCDVWVDERYKKYVEGHSSSFGQTCRRVRLRILSFISFRPGMRPQVSTGLQKRFIQSVIFVELSCGR